MKAIAWWIFCLAGSFIFVVSVAIHPTGHDTPNWAVAILGLSVVLSCLVSLLEALSKRLDESRDER